MPLMHSYNELLEGIKYISSISKSDEEEHNQEKFEIVLKSFRSIECKSRIIDNEECSFKTFLKDKYEEAKNLNTPMNNK